VNFQRRLAEADLSLTHTIIQPTTDKRTDCQILATRSRAKRSARRPTASSSGAAACWPRLRPTPTSRRCILAKPIPAGATEYAVAFAIPLDTPGLKFLCRDSASAPGADPFDKPLSSRFDEQDAFCIFDDVLVPWDRIFIDGDVEIYNSMRQTGYAIKHGHPVDYPSPDEARVRLRSRQPHGGADRRLLAGDDGDAGRDGLLRAHGRQCSGAVAGAGVGARGRRVVSPTAPRWSRCGRCSPVWMPRVAEIITLIGSHNLLTTPSRAQLDDPSCGR
jgi:hypothetical protein